jgi:hypothetical protein
MRKFVLSLKKACLYACTFALKNQAKVFYRMTVVFSGGDLLKAVLSAVHLNEPPFVAMKSDLIASA